MDTTHWFSTCTSSIGCECFLERADQVVPVGERDDRGTGHEWTIYFRFSHRRRTSGVKPLGFERLARGSSHERQLVKAGREWRWNMAAHASPGMTLIEIGCQVHDSVGVFAMDRVVFFLFKFSERCDAVGLLSNQFEANPPLHRNNSKLFAVSESFTTVGSWRFRSDTRVDGAVTLQPSQLYVARKARPLPLSCLPKFMSVAIMISLSRWSVPKETLSVAVFFGSRGGPNTIIS
ncbi:uncharacterized protein CLUP02_08895 [Colletotrichum lupini]|uniref:Uncharacterized protein n=1 Tax=Colletotrichum lupini TaxID=145971 RepID=A0A9Q8STY2_9PEZI|nr:uncharacterized protein CLUP02_08895 [Colletotrichum lupini]UQC83400.1 hypothetical protein CLUP02_08895 [Colletotrichum lupini]